MLTPVLDELLKREELENGDVVGCNCWTPDFETGETCAWCKARAELASLRAEVDSLGSKLAKAEMAAADLLEQAQSWKRVYEQRLAGIETLKAENAALLEKARLASDLIEKAVAWNGRHGLGDPDDEMVAEVDLEKAIESYTAATACREDPKCES